MEPAYITLKSPYGGFGLKTKTSQAACKRVDNLLAAHGVDVELRKLELGISEPCPPALAEAIVGPLDPGLAGQVRGAGEAAVPADELVRAHGHMIGEIAREAWNAFGPPPEVGAGTNRRPPSSHVSWSWRIRDVARATATYPTFCAFMHRHQAIMRDDHSSAVGVRGSWSFRLHSATRGVAAPPYPPSKILAHLCGRHASAFLDLVFPYDAPVEDFVHDFADVCDAMGMKLSRTALRLSSPTRRGGRKLTKVRIFDGDAG